MALGNVGLVSADHMPVDRRVRLGGPLNFRDVGGYATATGGVVRWRRVYRSDTLCHVTAADVEHLVDELGLLTIIDLRTATELEREGRGALAASNVDYHHIPIFDETQDIAGLIDRPLYEMYLSMLRNAGARIGAVVRVIAEAGNHPVVFHCAAGKDRTGLVAAVLLSLLGVSDDDVVADYVLTDDIMDEMRARARARAQAAGRPLRDVPAHVVRAEVPTMRRLLQMVRDEYGSVRDYLKQHGIADDTIEVLRSDLVTVASTVPDSPMNRDRRAGDNIRR